MIIPTIGRVVLFRINREQVSPSPALVTFVHSETSINCAGFNASGKTVTGIEVPLLQDDQLPPETGPYAEWMPYQKEAAAKAAE